MVDIQMKTEHTVLIDDLLGAYGFVLDERQFSRWPDLFADECFYALYSIENVERGLPLAYMLDDCRARIIDRVKFITEVWARTVEPYRTRHIVQRTKINNVSNDTYEVHANFLVGYTQADGTAGLLASGHYEDRIRVAGAQALFERRCAFLDNIPPRYLIYPL
jgi:salicylate 5-hydroxylase small subunit